MRWTRAATAVAVATALAPAASATVPPPIYPYSWYGPLTVCRDGYAIEVGAGEALTSHGAADIVKSPAGGLLVETFIYDLERDADIVQPRGELNVAGLGTVARYQMTSRNSDWRELGYIFLRQNYFPRVVVRSAQFAGTNADAALLRRIVTGEAAQALCAAVPPERQPRPESVNDMAALVRPTRHAGPLTLCWGRLALDVRVDEQALSGWRAEDAVAGVRFGGTTALLKDDTTGALAPSPLLPFGGFVEVVQLPSFAHLFHTTKITRPARLARPADLVARNSAGVSAAFFGPAAADDEYALLARIRGRTPTDTCFNPDKT